MGGEGCSAGTDFATISKGLRVRRIGRLLSILPLSCEFEASSSLFFGSVRAQFSHGIALFLSFSSYVFRKLESRRWMFGLLKVCPACNVAARGLSGGVSMIAVESCDLAWTSGHCDPFFLSECEGVGLEVLPTPIKPKPCCRFLDCELVLGRLECSASFLRHGVQSTGRPSVTINGVGP